MISQRRGYSFSECEAQLVERLGDHQSCPKHAIGSSVPHKTRKARNPAKPEERPVRPGAPRRTSAK
jgi:hypothetical protein